jgi:hypothetical protein
MSSLAQVQANRGNAQQSTGPKTPTGKARSAKNALCHGVRSEVPVLPGEIPEDWEAHRAGVLHSLGVVGALEAELAGRVALCLWRLRRVAAYETAITQVSLDEVPDEVRERATSSLLESPAQHDSRHLRKVEKDLAKKRETVQLWEATRRLLEQLPQLADREPVEADDVFGVFEDLLGSLPESAEGPDTEDDAFLSAIGVPADEQADPWNWRGWTASMVKKGLARIALAGKLAPEKLLARAVQERQQTQANSQQAVRDLERQARELRRRIKTHEDRLRQRRMLPDASTLEKITRYEGHLSRQMLQALHTLERLQAARAGQPVPPPAALDVTLELPTQETLPAAEPA